MMQARDAVVWVNYGVKLVMVRSEDWGTPDDHGYSADDWCDPIGAAYSDWLAASDSERVRLLLETVIDLAMQGFPLRDLLVAFASIAEFRRLGSESYPMCRALTSALVGRCLEPNTMSFEDLLVAYAPKDIS